MSGAEDTFKATPFTLLFVLYGCHNALRINSIENVDLKKQIELLQRDQISTREKRHNVIQELIGAGVTALEEHAYIRIHVQHTLGRYYRESYDLRATKDVKEWDAQQVTLSFVHHLIQNTLSDKKTDRMWEFANYLRKYFNREEYSGQAFLSAYGTDDSGSKSGKKGFGLQMMKNVCSMFTLKSGPFSKVKKKCNTWAAELYQQSQGKSVDSGSQQSGSNNSKNSKNSSNSNNSNNNNVSNPEPQNHFANQYKPNAQAGKLGIGQYQKKPHNYSKFVTDVSMYVNPQPQPPPQQSNSQQLNGKSWFWLYDNYGSNLKWVPYKQSDVQKLNMAWSNNQNSCLIVNGSYRVDFDRTGDAPAGNQFNTTSNAAGGRTVICQPQANNIHGVPVDNNPM